jgi:protein SCO1/2
MKIQPSKTFLTLAALFFAVTAFAQTKTNVTHYAVKGVFKESRADGRKAVIKHETIPGYMDAMTMPFNVKNPAVLKLLKPGDEITFRLSVTDTEDWIDEIKKAGEHTPTPQPAPPQPLTFTQELEPGALMPDCILTNQSGLAVRTGDFKGGALAFTFFFTRCPLPTYCPRMNSNLAAVQKALQTDTAHTNWQLLSISFDPQFDTPSQLAAQANFYQADTNHWNFATADPAVIRQLSGAFGLMFMREGGSISHNLRTVVVDAAGRVQKVFTNNEWQPAEVVAEMKHAMETKP